MSKPFKASQFKPTKWDTAEQKAKFANHLVKFVEMGCPWELFHDWFYTRLSTTFGHIAHYNRLGFYETWFRTATERKHFVRHLLEHPNYGQPDYTYCDAEKAIQEYVRGSSELVASLSVAAKAEQQEQNEHVAAVALAALPEDVRRKVAQDALRGL